MADQTGLAREAAALRPSLAISAKRMLVFIDDENCGADIARWLKRDALDAPVPEIVLLAVLPRPDEVRTRGIYIDKVRAHLRETGQLRLQDAHLALADAAIPHIMRVELGDAAQTILRCAREQKCDLIAIAGKSRGEWRKKWVSATGIVLDSLAGQVAEVADVPVVILKPDAR